MCATAGFASYRPRLGVVPAVRRRGSKLCPFCSARRGELLFVHSDVELGSHLRFKCTYFPLLLCSLPESHEHPSPPLSPDGSSLPLMCTCSSLNFTFFFSVNFSQYVLFSFFLLKIFTAFTLPSILLTSFTVLYVHVSCYRISTCISSYRSCIDLSQWPNKW